VVDRLVGDALDQLLVLAAVADEVGDGAELEAVLPAKLSSSGMRAMEPSGFMTRRSPRRA
jgi:hypothetical protein